MRAVATITVFVHGNSNTEIQQEANKMAKELNDKYDCQADIEKLQRLDFASNEPKDLKLKK